MSPNNGGNRAPTRYLLSLDTASSTGMGCFKSNFRPTGSHRNTQAIQALVKALGNPPQIKRDPRTVH